jgi:hypothetical protein|nr:MAG TPA: holin protein [Caudoviricetes sp.]DAN15221.1 MAG TPA: holin protein [Caudoviricetes sp.]DAO65682.1 MAG TPA: holin protein [Caudoviricetes sp.]DAS93013.1 MAG TPA: holin protein [Caudoviricetes sp.]DAW51240.1 MAG TPA: holin protein [Caudoviricetes sp.]
MSDGLILGLSTGVAMPLLTLIVKWFNDKDEKNLKEINSTLIEIKDLAQKTAVGTKTISRHRLLKDMNVIINRGYITSKELEDITILYQSYRELGGNSYVSDLYDNCRKLPIKEGLNG